MTGRKDLADDIAAWDGRASDAIHAVYAQHGTRAGFVDELLALAAQGSHERGATWLLKHRLEEREEGLPPEQADGFYALFGGLSHWESRLHALQCMARVPVPSRRVRSAKNFVERCLTSENKFVRAWAYSGLCAIAAANPRYQDEALELLRDAERADPSAAVRARARNLLKQPFGTTAK